MMANWALETINLGDKRLDEPLKMLAETLADKPGRAFRRRANQPVRREGR
jgi:hypothetical protein